MSDYADIDREFQNYQDRIADLEFEVEHERYNVEKTAQEAAKRIKVLEGAIVLANERVRLSSDDVCTAKDRIEALEVALREIDRLCFVIESAVRNADPQRHGEVLAALKIARAALAPEQDK